MTSAGLRFLMTESQLKESWTRVTGCSGVRKFSEEPPELGWTALPVALKADQLSFFLSAEVIFTFVFRTATSASGKS
jgi:hypothetical protein